MKFASWFGRKPAKIIAICLAAASLAMVAVSGCDSIITNVFLGDGGADIIDATAVEPPCESGLTRCDGAGFYTCRDGVYELDETCGQICDNTLGCVVCHPGSGTCSGETSSECKPDGSGYDENFCDPVQGMSCDASSGLCVGACSPQELGSSYIGCEYFPTMTANEVSNTFQFAVAIANTADTATTVTIEGGSLASPSIVSVAPGSVSIQRLPWLASLKAGNCTNPFGCGAVIATGGVLAVSGAFHLRSTGPVTVYQFSALDYQIGAAFSYSNDASLLLPSNVLGTDYVVAAWPAWLGRPGLTAITATRDGTNLTVLSKVAVAAGTGTPALAPGVAATMTLNQGDVLEFFGFSGDFTGSFVHADAPIQVIGGHYCTNIPANVIACDHIEESMFPITALGDSYVVAAPVVSGLPNGKVRIVRIVATKANTTITYDPPQAGAATTLANAGDSLQIVNTPASFSISADHKILVAQYMEGQAAGGGMGDPAFMVAVPSAQYRSNYLFHAPANYQTNYVNIVALDGETVTLDGTPVTGFTPVGAGYSLARVGLSAGNGGNHSISGSKAFGISVYGYGQYTSYWYAGGLDLESLSID